MPPQIRNPRRLELPSQAGAVLARMFPGHDAVIVHDDFSSLGYSGSWVYRVHVLGGEGHPELPLVVKLGPASLIAREALAYEESIRHQWPGIAELRDQPVYLEGAGFGGLCYSLMGGGVFNLTSLREYCLEASAEDVCFVLRERLFRIMLERMLRPAQNVFEHPLRASYDRVLPVHLLVEPRSDGRSERTGSTLVTPDAIPDPPLVCGAAVCLEGFVVTEISLRQRSVTLDVPPGHPARAFRLRLQPVGDASAYRPGQAMPRTEGHVRETRNSRLQEEVRKAVGLSYDLGRPTITPPFSDPERRAVLPNPLLALPGILDATYHVKVNAVHGDLNLENVLVDPQVRDVRLIDFGEARHDHVLHDLLRLETEVVVKILPVALAEAGLPPHAVPAIFEQLHCTTFQFDHSGTHKLSHAALEKPFAVLRTIRRAAREGLYNREDPTVYYQGLTVYLLSALKYANLDAIPNAKQVAFWSAAAAQHLLHAPSPCSKHKPVFWAGAACPYRSLFAFHEEHAQTFFGRERLVQDLLERQRAVLEAGEGYRMLAVIGPSGSGKSSLVRAGLAAALHRGEIAGSEAWQIVHCRPGEDPLRGLSAALHGAGVADLAHAARLSEDLRASERALHNAVCALSPGRRVFILVDQFEEVFSLCRDEACQRAFVDNLTYAAGVTGGQTVVLLVVRADFYGHCAAGGLAKLLPTHQVLVDPLTNSELRRAIEQPAYLAGRVFEAGLVDRLCADVRGRAGGLPLLQYALAELWDHCRGQVLTHDAYEQIGGVTGALEERAEQVYGALSAEERAACRRVLLRMVQPGQGAVDTCRRVPFVELAPPGRGAGVVENVLGRLVAARLVTTGRDDQGRVAQVAHEALVHGWRRLRIWVDENRQSLRVHRRLTEATRDWADSQRDASYLYWGTRLNQLERWLRTHADDLSAQEQAFVSACREEREARQRHRAEADSRRLAQSALRCAEDNHTLALLLAVEAGRAASTPAADEALRAALLSGYSLRLIGHAGAVRHASWEAGGSRIATAGADARAHVWRVDGADGAVVLRGHTDQVWQVSWCPLGKRVVTISDDGTARVWHAESGQQIALFSGHDAQVYRAAWSPDGSRIATAGGDGAARVWDADTGVQQAVLEVADRDAPGNGSRARVVHAAWSADGARLLTCSTLGGAQVWDVARAALLLSLDRASGGWQGVSRAQWSPDESRIATAAGSAVRLWRASDGRAEGILKGHAGWVFLTAWSPDGTRLLTASVDGTARVWSLWPGATGDDPGGRQLYSLTGHLVIRHAAWNGTGTRVLTAGDDGTARVWHADTGVELAVLAGHDARVVHAAWSRAATRIVTASDDGTARVWDIAGTEAFADRVSHMGGQELIEAACLRLERNMTRQEWHRFMRETPYRETCPGKPVPDHREGSAPRGPAQREEEWR